MSNTSEHYGTRVKADLDENIQNLMEERDLNKSEAVRYLLRQGMEAEKSIFFSNRIYVEPGLILQSFLSVAVAMGFFALVMSSPGWVSDEMASMLLLVAGLITLFGAVVAVSNSVYKAFKRRAMKNKISSENFE